MTITNDTLMWLAPLAGAVAMTITTLATIWFDKRRVRKDQREAALPSGPATAASFALAAEAAHAALDAVFKNASPGMSAGGRDTVGDTKVRQPEATHRP